MAVAPRRTIADQLLDAAFDCVAENGIDIAVREIAARAGLQGSAVNYHFGDKDRLLDAVFERAFARLQAAREEALVMWRHATPAAEHLPSFLSGLIEHATGPGLAANLILRDCLSDSMRRERPRAVAVRFFEAEESFYAQLAADCGAGPWQARALAAIMDSESLLHLATRRSLAAAPVLQETCRHATAVLMAENIQIETRWRAALAVSLGAFDPPASEAAAAIASAAATVIAESGARGVTHRAVAQRAAVTLAAVVYHFPNVRSLLNAGYMATYHDVLSATPAQLQEFPTMRAFIEPLLPICADRRQAIPRMTRGTDELLLSCARDGGLARLALDLRLSGGQTSYWALSRIAGIGHPVQPPTAHLYELYMTGLVRRLLATGTEPDFLTMADEITAMSQRIVS